MNELTSWLKGQVTTILKLILSTFYNTIILNVPQSWRLQNKHGDNQTVRTCIIHIRLWIFGFAKSELLKSDLEFQTKDETSVK